MPSPKDPQKFLEYRQKMSAIAKSKGFGKWMKGKDVLSTLTPEQRIKRSELSRQKSQQPEERKRRSDTAKALGYGKWMKGRHPSLETLLKIQGNAAKRKGKKYSEIYGPERGYKEALKRKTGNRKRWEGKETLAQIRPYQGGDSTYDDWRNLVYRRDCYTCQRCNQVGGKLNAHHVQSWSKFPELRYDILNGTTLCIACHKIENNSQRKIEKRG